MFERMKLEKEEGRGMESPTAGATINRGVDSVPEQPSSDRSATTTPVTFAPSAPQEKRGDAAAGDAKSEMVRLSETLKMLNSYSSLLNILTLMALTWHLVHLGQILHAGTECS